MPLEFCEADASSISDLQQFTCTSRAQFDPALRRKVHPEPWALEAQSLLRVLHPPLDGGESLILAYDETGLAAVCHYEFTCRSEDGEESTFDIRALACDVRCQRSGVGSELLTYVLDQIHESNFGHGTNWGVTTLIHEENQPSKGLAASHGFSYVRYEGEGYELWGCPWATIAVALP